MKDFGDRVSEPLTVVPSMVTYIGYHAAQRPDDTAVLINGQAITYGAFYRDIARMVAALREFELGPGHTVGIEHRNLYLHWLLLMALEALGVLTLSFDQGEIPFIEETLVDMDLILCTPEQQLPDCKRVHALEQSWFDGVMTREPESPLQIAPISADMPLRIVKSSGTTGSLKQMVHSGQVFNFVLEQVQFRIGFTRGSRYILVGGFNIQAYQYHASACIRMGGICVIGDPENFAQSLSKSAITHATFLPHTLIDVLDRLPENYVKAPDLTIITIGAPVSVAVRDRVKRELANDLMETYATNETATICVINDNREGTVVPGVQAEVVDDDGNPVFGVPGLVRIKSRGCVTGYLNDAEATKRMFRDGWFYPGDVAIMKNPNSLTLIGRADDLLNVRGFKFAPQELEEQLLNTLPVNDLCLTVIADGDGIDQVFIVVVNKKSEFDDGTTKKIMSFLPDYFGDVIVVSVTKIPRTATGKIQRQLLKQTLQQQINARPAL